MGKVENLLKEQKCRENIFNSAITFKRWFYGRLAYTYTNLAPGDKRPATEEEKQGVFFVAESKLAFYRRFSFIPKEVTDLIRELIDVEEKELKKKKGKSMISRLLRDG